MDSLLNAKLRKQILMKSERLLLKSAQIKFQRNINWRRKNVPNSAGLYALFDNKQCPLYIGESGNLFERMGDINRTENHSFRKQLGIRKFNGTLVGRKFSPEIENLLHKYYDEKLYVNFLEVNFGRLEIESFLISRYQYGIYNSIKKRK